MQELDSSLDENQTDLIQSLRMSEFREIHELLTVIIQEKDFDTISSILEPFGFPITHIASTGGFLGRRNATLLIGVPSGAKDRVQEVIKNATKGQAHITTDNTSDIKKGIATLFTLEVERYEEI